MAEEDLRLVPSDTVDGTPIPYVIDFNGQQRNESGIKYRLGRNRFGEPVVQKLALSGADAVPRLERERQVAKYLGRRGGELIGKCLGYNFDEQPPFVVVTHRGRPLAEVVCDKANWPLGHDTGMRIVIDLLQGLELLRVSRVVHGGIGLDTLRWDGTTLQIVDFGQAALAGTTPEGRPARHEDDIREAGFVIYQILTGTKPPKDPTDLRHQILEVQDSMVRDLLLRRDPVTRAVLDDVFAEDPDARPSSRVLLDRLKRTPRNVREDALAARDQELLAAFAQLRARQRMFRAAYRPWAASRPALRPRRRIVSPRRTFITIHPAAGTPAWAAPVAVTGMFLLLILLIGLLL